MDDVTVNWTLVYCIYLFCDSEFFYHVFCKVPQLNNQYVLVLNSVFSLLKGTDWRSFSTSHLSKLPYVMLFEEY